MKKWLLLALLTFLPVSPGGSLNVGRIVPTTATSNNVSFASMEYVSASNDFTSPQMVGGINNTLFVYGTDIASTISAACAASPVEAVAIAPGTYKIRGAITDDCDGLKVYGIGPPKSVHLVAAPGYSGQVFNLSHNRVEVSGLWIDCNNSAANVMGIAITTSDSSSIHDNYIDSCNYGIRAGASVTNFKVYKNILNNANTYGILGLAPNKSFNWEIYSNILLGNSASTILADGDGISIDCGLCTAGQEIFNVLDHDNYVTNYQSPSAEGSANGAARVVHGLNISNNTSTNSYECIHVEDDTYAPIINGNYCYNNKRGGLNVFSTSQSGRAVVRNATISGNTAIGNGSNQTVHGIYGAIGCIGTGVCSGFTVTGNKAVANQADGFDFALADSTFEGNEAKGNNILGLKDGADYYLPTTLNSHIAYH